MEFEFDEAKSRENRAKHGIDFVEAQSIWEDSDLLEIQARTEDEPRAMVIGKIAEKHWAAIITYRGGRVRIISVRCARKEEKDLYES